MSKHSKTDKRLGKRILAALHAHPAGLNIYAVACDMGMGSDDDYAAFLRGVETIHPRKIIRIRGAGSRLIAA